jgi:hypothetical protein
MQFALQEELNIFLTINKLILNVQNESVMLMEDTVLNISIDRLILISAYKDLSLSPK